MPSGATLRRVISLLPAGRGGGVSAKLPAGSAVVRAKTSPLRRISTSAPGRACPAITLSPSGSMRMTSKLGPRGASALSVFDSALGAGAGSAARRSSEAGAPAVGAGEGPPMDSRRVPLATTPISTKPLTDPTTAR